MDTFSKLSFRKAISGTQDFENDSRLWTHKNGRTFTIEWSGIPDHYYITENTPLYRVSIKNRSKDGTIVTHFIDDHSIRDHFISDPNKLSAFVRNTHGDGAEALRYPPATDIRRLRGLSKDEAIKCVSDCIGRNEYFIPPLLSLDLSYQRMSTLASEESAAKTACVEIAPITNATHQTPWLFRGLCDRNGPLQKPVRDLILAHLNAPSEETWDAVARETISRTIRYHSAWSTWIQIRPEEAQRCLVEDSRWEKYPDKETFIAILDRARTAVSAFESAPTITPEDMLRSTIRRENLIRGQIGMPELQPDEIEAAMGDPSAWVPDDQKTHAFPRKIC
ncbi:hypothetical protein [Acetobacter persici]|uniref:Uncharacterized protein n=1 Tax=Acetobacter persici TaxID=1076596 RepID=A0A1U9LJJ0_9PROT|nr:hypothetical protein [Acetobacter persici]AQT06592.1 hypothetical protein A0U91_16420 [Acetobacter persici]